MNLLVPFDFELPTRIIYGPGVSSQLPDALKELGFKRVLVVTDAGVAQAGLLSPVVERLERADIVFEVFDAVEPNPKDYNVENGAQAARRLKADGLVALGGGSPIDCAKAIAVVGPGGRKPRWYEDKSRISNDVLPLVAIPTTAGTGSEVTFGSVITDSADRFKFSIKHRAMGPKIALVDPELTLSMPPALTASTGMDALTHAIEGYTALGAEPLADAASLYAIELIHRYLRTAVTDGNNLEARAGMLIASLLAGIGFSHSDVAAVHCIAEALGGRYDAPHGVCNAVVLPAMMQYNMESCRQLYARAAVAMGLDFESTAEGARKAVQAVRQLAIDVKLPSFESFGIPVEDYDIIAEYSAVNGSNSSNPRPMDKSDYMNVLQML